MCALPILPLASGRRAVAPAGEVARVARRCDLAPRIDRGAAGAQHVLELGLAGQAVAMPALFGQPLGVGLGIPGAHMQDRDRKSVVSGKSVSVRVDLGGRRIISTKIYLITYNDHKINALSCYFHVQILHKTNL